VNYCSNCGNKGLRFEVPEGDNLPRHFCKSCGAIHYQNPKIVVGCLPIFEDRILLCRRAIEPRKGMWNLPAGFMENGETVEQGAMREMWEETLSKVEIIRLHCIYNLTHVNQVYMIFLAKLENTNLVEKTPESLEIKLFSQNEIPWNEIAFTSTKFALEKYFSHQNHLGTHLGQYILPKDGRIW
jgi:ADP-ribose pyrophosphatase YjhB (NUDIX family)